LIHEWWRRSIDRSNFTCTSCTSPLVKSGIHSITTQSIILTGWYSPWFSETNKFKKLKNNNNTNNTNNTNNKNVTGGANWIESNWIRIESKLIRNWVELVPNRHPIESDRIAPLLRATFYFSLIHLTLLGLGTIVIRHRRCKLNRINRVFE
jgi:hypothetical protein